ncbi:Lysosomal acid phosphatase (LAP) [Durusdinium trenchii]|uniref:Lysosomal acid phosphatase (LAP) n=1 Tax=Durusdinium trenchii TaxID=1381693 RepID=A0ABP0HS37_9DINO
MDCARPLLQVPFSGQPTPSQPSVIEKSLLAERRVNRHRSPALALSRQVHCESSALARTLQSAYALQEGLFPGGSVAEAAPAVPLPVYSRPTGEDFILRGYTKCSVQAQKLKDWYSSPEFQAKATDTKAFRSQMAEALGRVNVTEDGTAAPLADWWNVYDELAVAAQAPSGGPVNGSQLQQAERLAAWLEAKKFSPQIAGTSCGGALLSAIGEQLDLSKDPKLRLVHYSAHYATMLCLMSALGVPASSNESSWIFSELLGLSSLLAFELEELPTGEMVIGLHYWPGSDSFSSSWRTVELPCVSGKCTEKQFQSLVSVGGQPSRTAWCEACQSFQLPLCAAPAPRGRLAHQRWDLPAFAFVFLGIGLAALGAAGCYAFRRSWRSCFFSEEESRSMMADRGTGNAIGACSPAPSL